MIISINSTIFCKKKTNLQKLDFLGLIFVVGIGLAGGIFNIVSLEHSKITAKFRRWDS